VLSRDSGLVPAWILVRQSLFGRDVTTACSVDRRCTLFWIQIIDLSSWSHYLPSSSKLQCWHGCLPSHLIFLPRHSSHALPILRILWVDSGSDETLLFRCEFVSETLVGIVWCRWIASSAVEGSFSLSIDGANMLSNVMVFNSFANEKRGVWVGVSGKSDIATWLCDIILARLDLA
jgi:hypothetical protein